MRVTTETVIVKEPEFKPFTLDIEFTTLDQVLTFFALFDHATVVRYLTREGCRGLPAEIRSALRERLGYRPDELVSDNMKYVKLQKYLRGEG